MSTMRSNLGQFLKQNCLRDALSGWNHSLSSVTRKGSVKHILPNAAQQRSTLWNAPAYIIPFWAYL